MYLFQVNTYGLIGTFFCLLAIVMSLAFVKLSGQINSKESEEKKELRSKIEAHLLRALKYLTVVVILLVTLILFISFLKPELNSIKIL